MPFLILEKPDGTPVVAKADSSGNLQIGAAAGSGGALESGGNLAGINEKLPTAAALSDAFAQPATSTTIGALLMAWSGAAWKRLLLGVQAAASSLSVTIASDDALIAPMAASGATQQITLGASATPTATAAKQFVRCTALQGNAQPAYVTSDNSTAASATAGDEIPPGTYKDFPVNNASRLRVFGTASDKLNVTAF